MDAADGGLALPSITASLTAGLFALLGDRSGEFSGQIEIAANALVIGTVKAKQRLRMSEIEHALDFTVRGHASRSDISEDYTQGLKAGKFLHQAR